MAPNIRTCYISFVISFSVIASVIHSTAVYSSKTSLTANVVSSASKTFDLNDVQRQAKAGNAVAQFEFGYYQGTLDKSHWSEAFKWYQLSAKQGNAGAEYALGLLYSTGSGVKKNEPEALKWFTKSARQGHAGAESTLGHWFHIRGNFTEAVRWYRLAANQGGPSTPFIEAIIGDIYAEGGNGVKTNWREAYYWYSIAATSPDPLKHYVTLRDQAAKNLTVDQIAAVQKRVGNWKPIPTQATLATEESRRRVNQFIQNSNRLNN